MFLDVLDASGDDFFPSQMLWVCGGFQSMVESVLSSANFRNDQQVSDCSNHR